MLAFTSLKSWLRNRRLGGIGTALLLWLAPGVGMAQEDRVLAKGQQEYRKHCAICHGVRGTGDGLLSTLLTVAPADLTQLRKKNNGEFSFWRIYKVIDGRDIAGEHGASTMPVWGPHFLGEEGGGYLDEDRVIGRILSLVYYLQSLQEK